MSTKGHWPRPYKGEDYRSNFDGIDFHRSNKPSNERIPMQELTELKGQMTAGQVAQSIAESSPVMPYIETARMWRTALDTAGRGVRALMNHPGLSGLNSGPGEDRGEARANIMLAYRHLEDARMRLGKSIQAMEGGVSCYDRAKDPPAIEKLSTKQMNELFTPEHPAPSVERNPHFDPNYRDPNAPTPVPGTAEPCPPPAGQPPTDGQQESSAPEPAN